jgi:hypothetical protein
MAFASKMILGSESHRTQDLILPVYFGYVASTRTLQKTPFPTMILIVTVAVV